MRSERAPKAQKLVCAALLVLGTSSLSSLAFGADAPKSEAEATKLMVDLQRQLQEQMELVDRDCTTACRALQSMQRAADRICDLEPGPRCKDAKSKADEAAGKVHARCPDCVIAQRPPRKPHDEEDEKRANEPASSKKGAPGAADAPPAPAPATQSESVKSGGCRSCNESGTSPSDLAPALLAALAVLGLRKRRR